MASKRHQRRRLCESKTRYATKEEADGRARLVTGRRVLVNTNGVSSYKCDFCGGWHIGHTPYAKSGKSLRKERT